MLIKSSSVLVIVSLISIIFYVLSFLKWLWILTRSGHLFVSGVYSNVYKLVQWMTVYICQISREFFSFKGKVTFDFGCKHLIFNESNEFMTSERECVVHICIANDFKLEWAGNGIRENCQFLSVTYSGTCWLVRSNKVILRSLKQKWTWLESLSFIVDKWNFYLLTDTANTIEIADKTILRKTITLLFSKCKF